MAVPIITSYVDLDCPVYHHAKMAPTIFNDITIQIPLGFLIEQRAFIVASSITTWSPR